MGQLKKGDKVRFEKKSLADELGDSPLEDIGLNWIHTVSGINPEGKVFLEGYGDIAYDSDLFERVCSICQDKKVLLQMQSLNKCYDCASKYREEKLEKLKDALSLKQNLLLEEYLRAEEDFNSINLIH